jgi:hypothetical protein
LEPHVHGLQFEQILKNLQHCMNILAHATGDPRGALASSAAERIADVWR